MNGICVLIVLPGGSVEERIIPAPAPEKLYSTLLELHPLGEEPTAPTSRRIVLVRSTWHLGPVRCDVYAEEGTDPKLLERAIAPYAKEAYARTRPRD